MRRSEFEQLIKEQRKEAMIWLAQQMFDTHDLESLKETWVDFFTGEITLQPLSHWSPEVLLQIADETVTWDDEDTPDIKVGDTVTRMVLGTVPMSLQVTAVEDGVIYCGGGWKFCAETGAEIDEDCGWGPPPQHTGSHLQEVVKGPN